eukprot:m.71015 g.71015  ORF g.71015 m.71015 type:complete len:126 (+) comp10046_c0_seq3:3475-3852(+)
MRIPVNPEECFATAIRTDPHQSMPGRREGSRHRRRQPTIGFGGGCRSADGATAASPPPIRLRSALNLFVSCCVSGSTVSTCAVLIRVCDGQRVVVCADPLTTSPVRVVDQRPTQSTPRTHAHTPS